MYFSLQVQLLDTKRQLDTEINLHLSTKELLKNAQKESATLKQHLSNMEVQLASQSSQRTGKGNKIIILVIKYFFRNICNICQ